MLRVKKFRFLEGGLAGDVYFDRSRESFEGLALFAFGFPSFPGPNGAIEALAESGLVVISPHFHGTYDSTGEFAPESLVKTVEDTANLVRRGYLAQGKDSRPFYLPSRWVVSVGHSFGCAAAIRSWSYLPGLEALLLLAPTAHYSTNSPDYGVREDGMAQLDYVRHTHPFTYRIAPDESWRDFFSEGDMPPEWASELQSPATTVVIGSEDAYFDIQVATDNLPKLISAFVGDDSPSIRTLPGCGHPLGELLNTKLGFPIGEYARDLVARKSKSR